MDIPTHAELVERIDHFLERHSFAPTRLGREATGEPNLIPSIKAGRQPNLDTLNRLCRVMADYDAKLPIEAEPETKPEWPIASANNEAEIIPSEPAGGEAGHGAPFAASGGTPREALPLHSSATSSATPAPRRRSPENPACSTAGEADTGTRAGQAA